jgi:glyoxylase-like metal-dependent hydrolase (beta-lactamase superfamily II)
MSHVQHTDFKLNPQITQVGCYWGVGGHTELYLLEGEQIAVVDTGVSYTPEQYLTPALAAIGRTLADVDVIINTHGHHDHAGGNAQVLAASSCEIWLPRPDVEIAENPERQFELYFAQNDVAVGREDRLAESLAELRLNAGPLATVTRPLDGGDVLDLGRGLVLSVIPTPGHTVGSCCFYWEREGILIAGDAILGRCSRATGLPLIYYPEQYGPSLDRIEDLDLNVLAIGHHYASLTMTRESVKWGRAGKQFVRESRQIDQLIGDAMADALKGGPRPFLDAAREATKALAGPLSLRIDPETGLAIGQGVAALWARWKRAT